MPCVLCAAVHPPSEMGFYILKILADMRVCGADVPVSVHRRLRYASGAAPHSDGNLLINRGEDHPGDVSGREIGRTAGGLQVSDRVGRTGGREADHGFAAKKA